MLNYDFRDQNLLRQSIVVRLVKTTHWIPEADDVHIFSLTLSNLLYQNEGKIERHLRT